MVSDNARTFGGFALQVAGALVALVGVYGVFADKVPNSFLALGAGAVAVVLGITGVMTRRETAGPLNSDACIASALLVGAAACFLYFGLPGVSPETVSQNVRSRVDIVASSVGIPVAPTTTAATYAQARFVPANSQSNDFARALGRAFDDRARVTSPRNPSPYHVDIAATVDGAYTNLASREFRARAAVTLRARDTGFSCTITLSEDGAIEGAARVMAGEVLRRAVEMMDGAEQC